MPSIQPRFTPLWEKEVTGYYRPVTMEREARLYSCTFGKNAALRQSIRQNIDPRWPNMLYIGLGRGEGATDYLEILGLLENISRSYQMTLLDNDLITVENARTRRTIRRDPRYSHSGWQQYISDTGQTGTITEATVPRSYQRKKDNGDITFLTKDIVKDVLDMHETFNISHCVDVLCFQTDEDILLLALQRLGYVTKQGGLVIVDDGPNTLSFKNPRIRAKVERWGRELHLQIEREIERPEGRYLLLRKL